MAYNGSLDIAFHPFHCIHIVCTHLHSICSMHWSIVVNFLNSIQACLCYSRILYSICQVFLWPALQRARTAPADIPSLGSVQNHIGNEYDSIHSIYPLLHCYDDHFVGFGPACRRQICWVFACVRGHLIKRFHRRLWLALQTKWSDYYQGITNISEFTSIKISVNKIRKYYFYGFTSVSDNWMFILFHKNLWFIFYAALWSFTYNAKTLCRWAYSFILFVGCHI